MRPDYPFISFFFVFLGGGVGSLIRYSVSLLGFSTLPFLSTLIVNGVGSLLVGLLSALVMKTTWFTPSLQIFLITGVCGGLTTFSTFTYENLVLFQNGEVKTALYYIFGSLVVSFVAVYLGYILLAGD